MSLNIAGVRMAPVAFKGLNQDNRKTIEDRGFKIYDDPACSPELRQAGIQSTLQLKMLEQLEKLNANMATLVKNTGHIFPR